MSNNEQNDGPVLKWPSEEIPDGDEIFMRAHKGYFKNGTLLPGVFKDIEGGMSTDWSKYSTAAQSRARAKKPPDNAIVSLPVGATRLLALQVAHSPDMARNNRAHTDVLGEKTTELRVKLLGICTMVLELES